MRGRRAHGPRGGGEATDVVVGRLGWRGERHCGRWVCVRVTCQSEARDAILRGEEESVGPGAIVCSAAARSEVQAW